MVSRSRRYQIEKKLREQGANERWIEARKTHCEACDRPEQRHMAQHHVVYQQHVRAAGGDVWDPRNSMTLCDGSFSCHARHHARTRVIPTWRLPSAAVAFAVSLFGPAAAYEYLRRYYLVAAPDHRLDELIEAA